LLSNQDHPLPNPPPQGGGYKLIKVAFIHIPQPSPLKGEGVKVMKPLLALVFIRSAVKILLFDGVLLKPCKIVIPQAQNMLGKGEFRQEPFHLFQVQIFDILGSAPDQNLLDIVFP